MRGFQRGSQPIYSPYNVGSAQNPYAAMGYATAPQAQAGAQAELPAPRAEHS